MANIPISALPNVKPTGFTPSDLLVLVNYFDPPFTGVTKNTELSGITSYVLSAITANTFTYNQMSGLTSTNSLIPGQFYFITNADVKLYGGTLILIQAVTTNKLALQAEGLFYTPKYKQGFPGLGIWSSTNSYSIGNVAIWGGYTWTNVTGNSGIDDDIYTLNNLDWSLIPYNTTDYNVFIDEIHYDFDNDRIIYRKDKSNNEVSTSEENIKYFEVTLGSLYHPIKIFQWGNGYITISNIGIGNNIIRDSLLECINFKGDSITNNIFEQESYLRDTTFYESSKFDNNYLGSSFIYGSNVFSGSTSFTSNTLKFGSQIYSVNFNNTNFSNNLLDETSSIYNITDNDGSTISYNSLNSSYFNTVTFFGSTNLNYNTLNDNSFFSNLSLTASSVTSNILKDASYINSLYFESSSLDSNYLEKSCYINIITMFNSNILENILTSNSFMETCTLTSSNISYNKLSNSSYFSSQVMDTSNINNNILSNSSYFSSQVMDTSNINNNILSNSSHITNHNIFSGASNINYNTLNNASFIEGNSLDNSTIQSNNLVNNSFIQTNTLTISSNIQENYLENYTYLVLNTLTNVSNIIKNELKNDSYIRENNCSSGVITENRLFSDSYILSNILDNKSSINSNDLFSSSYISTNSITGVSSVNSNVITNSSYIFNNILNVSSVQNNKLQNLSRVTNNILDSSYFENNSFQSDSLIDFTDFTFVNFTKNNLFNTYMDFSTSGTLPLSITKVHSRDCNISDDISSATIIYGDFSKWIFQNSTPTPRLSYYDGSDVLNIVNINA